LAIVFIIKYYSLNISEISEFVNMYSSYVLLYRIRCKMVGATHPSRTYVNLSLLLIFSAGGAGGGPREDGRSQEEVINKRRSVLFHHPQALTIRPVPSPPPSAAALKQWVKNTPTLEL
jgi:hypothetical protein